jgi:glycine oxidase
VTAAAASGADVVVIGGGIVGCACAYELAKRGARVTLLEYGKTGMQATNAAAGMLAPISDTHAPDTMFRTRMQALREYAGVVDELQSACGFDVEYRADGILKVAFSDDEAALLQRRVAWQRELGIDVELLDAATCRELEPKLSDRVVAGAFSASEATVSNQLITLAYERAAIALGASIVQRAPVTKAVRSRGSVKSVTAGETGYNADTFVLAAGARSGQIAAKLGLTLPVFPVRGQMIALGGMVTPIRQVVWGSAGYLVPRANGLIFAGATVEDVGFRRRTTQAGIRAMRSMAIALVPQLSAAKVHFDWAGLRPATADGAPIIGPVPGTNVIAATGHYRNGILLAPLTARFIARGICDGDWDAVPSDFLPSRFAAS